LRLPGLRACDDKHSRAAVQMNVLPARSDQRAFGAVRTGGVQIQTVQTENTAAVRSELAGGIEAAGCSSR